MHELIILILLPPTCITYTIAILLHDCWAMYDPPSTSLVYTTHHIILVITISCKGQVRVRVNPLVMAMSCKRQPCTHPCATATLESTPEYVSFVRKYAAEWGLTLHP